MMIPEDQPENLALLQAVIRQHNAAKIRGVIDSLEPQIDGSFGPINPRMVEVYLKALRELGSLYRVYDRLPPQEQEDEAERTVSQLRAQVAAQLEDLAAKRAQTEGIG